jgi:hypothetical protein
MPARTRTPARRHPCPRSALRSRLGGTRMGHRGQGLEPRPGPLEDGVSRQPAFRYLRTARRTTSPALTPSASARSSRAWRSSGSNRTGRPSAGPEPIDGRPGRRRSLLTSRPASASAAIFSMTSSVSSTPLRDFPYERFFSAIITSLGAEELLVDFAHLHGVDEDLGAVSSDGHDDLEHACWISYHETRLPGECAGYLRYRVERSTPREVGQGPPVDSCFPRCGYKVDQAVLGGGPDALDHGEEPDQSGLGVGQALVDPTGVGDEAAAALCRWGGSRSAAGGPGRAGRSRGTVGLLQPEGYITIDFT